MNRVPVLVAVGCLLLLAAVARAGDDTSFPAYEKLPTLTLQDTAPALDVEKATAAQALQAQHAVPETAEASPVPNTVPMTAAMPPQTVESQVVPAGAAGGPCCAGGANPGCWGHLWAWLTYQPLCRTGACGCCQGVYPCCNPPLYAYFPCPACSNGGGHGGCATGHCDGGACAAPHGPGFFARLTAVFHRD